MFLQVKQNEELTIFWKDSLKSYAEKLFQVALSCKAAGANDMEISPLIELSK